MLCNALMLKRFHAMDGEQLLHLDEIGLPGVPESADQLDHLGVGQLLGRVPDLPLELFNFQADAISQCRKTPQ